MKPLSLSLVMCAALAVGSEPAQAESALWLPPGATPPGLVASAPAQDTVLQVREGDRLLVENLAGRISVRAGRGDRIRVDLGPSDEGSITLSRSGNRIVMTDRDRKGRQLDRRLEIVVPSWLAVEVRGRRVDVDVEGLRQSVTASTIQGDLRVRDVEGTVTLATVSGTVLADDVVGSVTARTVEGSARLRGIEGDVIVHTADGDITLVDVDAARVEVQTVGGDVEFEGAIRAGGDYSLVTHDGDVTATIPPSADVSVSVSTFDGSFEAGFPVTLDRFRAGREMMFTLGNGSAKLVLQAFDGEIRLLHQR